MTRADREKKAAKRERRLEAQPQRQAEREVRERWAKIPLAVRRRYQHIANLYERATRAPVISQVVCEKCNFAQPYVTDDDDVKNFDVVFTEDEVAQCLRGVALDLPCDGEYCVTVERFSEDTEHREHDRDEHQELDADEEDDRRPLEDVERLRPGPVLG